MSSGMQDIIDDLRDETMVLSQSLQVANSERDLLRRQVEVLAKEFSRHAACDRCICDHTCHKTTRAVYCGESIKQWSLEQAKGGGGGN